MATGTTSGSGLEKIISHLECSICTDRYKRPKILDCQHSFCEECLEKFYSNKYAGASKIPCPECRRETVLPETCIQGLKTNFHLMSIVEEFALQEKMASLGNAKALCEICDEENEAVHRCLDCAQNICSNCHKTHLRFAATSGHQVATLEDIRRGKVAVAKRAEADGSKCHKHKGEVKRFYCLPCKELICRDCTVVDHSKPQHEYIDSGKAFSKFKQSLTNMFPNFKEEINGLQEVLAASSQAKQKLSKRTMETVKQVQDRAARMRAEVTTQEKKMIQEAECLQQDRNKAITKHEETVTVALQRKQHSLDTAKEVVDTASESDFLSLYPIIIKDLKSMSGPNPRKIDPKLLCLCFTLGQGIDDINLGKLQVEVSKWQMSCEFGKWGSGPGEFLGATGISSTPQGEIAVADSQNKRVVLYSTKGYCRGSIPMPKGSFSRDTAAFHNQLLVVDDTKYIKMFTKDGKFIFMFSTVPSNDFEKTRVDLQSVAVKKDGTIIVGDVKRMVLTEHRRDGMCTVPVKTPPYYLAVDDCSDGVVISGWDCQQVDVADSKGITQSTINPTINGQRVKYCHGVCCDSSGIYVAVCNDQPGTGHIHHYDEDGDFLQCICQGLQYPHGIALTADGQLAVADHGSIKVYHKVYHKV